MKKTTETKLHIPKAELLAAFGIKEEDAVIAVTLPTAAAPAPPEETGQELAPATPLEIAVTDLTITVTKTEEVRRKALPGVE